MRTILYSTLFLISLPLLVRASNLFEYIHVETEMTWDAAQQYCRAKYLDLAIIDDQEQIEAYPCGKDKPCWIGLHRDEEDADIWRWPNGDEIKKTHWHRYQPSNRLEKCGLLKDDGWHDAFCNYEFEFLCYEIKELVLVREKKSWEDAQEYCNALGAGMTDLVYNLAHVTTENAYAAADEMMQALILEVWTGIRFLGGHWFWVNGEDIAPEIRRELTPCSADKLKCGLMSTRGGELTDCSEKRSFFCSATIIKKND